MKTITFKEFWKDYREHFKVTEKHMVIKTECEMENTMDILYDTEDYEIDYENKIIELY